MEKTLWIEHKIMNRDQLVRSVNGWRAANQKIVFTNGCFDILHRGHLAYLLKAADEGNRLIIGVNSDSSVRELKGEGRPVNNEADRLFQLASLLFVDAVCLFEEETPLELIRAVMPDVLAKGGDYTIETIVGADLVQANTGKVSIIPFVDGYSTTSLIEKLRK